MLKLSKILFICLLMSAFSSCKSFKEKVISKKTDFIQIAQKHAYLPENGEFGSIEEIINHVKEGTTEDELKYLEVEIIEVNFPNSSSSKIHIDSTVSFIKGNDFAIYDFATTARDLTTYKYPYLEKVAERLFVGKFK